MATHTLGTATNVSLTAIPWSPSPQVLAPADLTTLHGLINGVFPQMAHPVTYLGKLFLPGRPESPITLRPGDIIATDPVSGWPIILPAAVAATANWHYV
jgi:hypothetical protein